MTDDAEPVYCSPEGHRLLGPNDRLTDAQSIRLHTAVARLKAIRAALDAGMSVAEVECQEWIITVTLLDEDGNPKGPPHEVIR